MGTTRSSSCSAARSVTEVDARDQAATRPFDHKVIFRRTEFRCAQRSLDEKPKIQELYAWLIEDPIRNDLIFCDILTALEAGRSPVVITERRDHVTMLADRLARFAKNVLGPARWHEGTTIKSRSAVLGEHPRPGGTGAGRHRPLSRRRLR
jgi:hypothetical protein